MKTGILLAIFAYTLWGLLPIYWKSIQHLPPFEILCHRIVWSFLFLSIAQTVIGNWRNILNKLKDSKTRITFIVTSCIIGANWLLYVWAVNSGYVVEASLGYFINPLISVFLGVAILRERLRPFQWTAVGIAAVGVFYLTFIYGAFPWIALLLAVSFGLYGLFRKIGKLNAVEGLTFETGLLFIPCLVMLFIRGENGSSAFGPPFSNTTLLLALTGVVSALPLTLFAAAARRIPLSLVGIIQYILPTLLFILGVFMFHEPFSRERRSATTIGLDRKRQQSPTVSCVTTFATGSRLGATTGST